jgi:hypothetical protein
MNAENIFPSCHPSNNPPNCMQTEILCFRFAHGPSIWREACPEIFFQALSAGGLTVAGFTPGANLPG